MIITQKNNLKEKRPTRKKKESLQKTQKYLLLSIKNIYLFNIFTQIKYNIK